MLYEAESIVVRVISKKGVQKTYIANIYKHGYITDNSGQKHRVALDEPLVILDHRDSNEAPWLNGLND